MSRLVASPDSNRGVRITVAVLLAVALAIYVGFILRGVLGA